MRAENMPRETIPALLRLQTGFLNEVVEVTVIVNHADREIIKWAVDRMLPWYYTRERGLPDPCLKVHFGHITAYFYRGQLVRLWTQADQGSLDDMFCELMVLFDLCGSPRSILFCETPGGRLGRLQSGDEEVWG